MADPLKSDSSQRTLLHIPRNDLSSSQTNTKNQSSLSLLQLPDGWTYRDLQQAHILAKPKQQAVLIAKNQSFTLHQLETSNVCILIPPVNDTDTQPPPNKQSKTSHPATNASTSSTTTSTTTNIRNTRLLRPGGSGASFLELRPQLVQVSSVRDAIPLWDPYQSSQPPKGLTTQLLADKLLLAPAQIQHTIRQYIPQAIQALQPTTGSVEPEGRDCDDDDGDDDSSNKRKSVPCSKTASTLYLRVAEEAWLDALHALVATLHETGHSYSHPQDSSQHISPGILVPNPEQLVQDTLERMDEIYQDRESVVRAALASLAGPEDSHGSITLDATQVAVCVAKRLMLRQSQPWDCQVFETKWLAQLPGITSRQSVNPGMLHGVAVRRTLEDGADVYQYFPAEALPSSDPAAFFAALFQAKDAWTEEEIAPYLECLELEWGMAPSEWLLRFSAQETTSGDDGVVTKYVAKK